MIMIFYQNLNHKCSADYKTIRNKWLWSETMSMGIEKSTIMYICILNIYLFILSISGLYKMIISTAVCAAVALQIFCP